MGNKSSTSKGGTKTGSNDEEISGIDCSCDDVFVKRTPGVCLLTALLVLSFCLLFCGVGMIIFGYTKEIRNDGVSKFIQVAGILFLIISSILLGFCFIYYMVHYGNVCTDIKESRAREKDEALTEKKLNQDKKKKKNKVDNLS